VLRIPFKKMETADRVELRLRLSEEIYRLLADFCTWTGNDIDTYVEYCIFSTIKSELSAWRELRGEVKELLERIRELRDYF